MFPMSKVSVQKHVAAGHEHVTLYDIPPHVSEACSVHCPVEVLPSALDPPLSQPSAGPGIGSGAGVGVGPGAMKPGPPDESLANAPPSLAVRGPPGPPLPGEPPSVSIPSTCPPQPREAAANVSRATRTAREQARFIRSRRYHRRTENARALRSDAAERRRRPPACS